MNETKNISMKEAPLDETGAKPRVALGMSGGVDSSVAAALLLEAGFSVVGVTCVFVDDASNQHAVNDARRVADSLGIPLMVKDCTGRFACNVVRPFVDAYASGLTPSPCVNCNVSCKIPALIEAADELGCAYVATGHYARVFQRGARFAVAVAADAAKDQSYMLSLLTQPQLARLLLPLGDVAGGKPEVRKMAEERGLPTASKSDSQDICFIGGSHVTFLEERGVSAKPGAIVNAQGQELGKHQGLHRYTVGQRKGIGIGGAPEPYFVLEKDGEGNRLVVGFAAEAKMKAAVVADVNWQGLNPVEHAALACEEGLACTVKLRYRQRAVPCRATLDAQDQLLIHLEAPQPLTAPGQYAVLYAKDTVLAAGVISEVVRI